MFPIGHLGMKKEEVLRALASRLDKNPIGAPMNETLMEILHTMYTYREAEIASQFPQGFTTVERLAELTGIAETELVSHLNNMADKGLVMDFPRKGRSMYVLSPLVIGFFEYTFMRVTDKLPQKDLAELFERYFRDRRVAGEFFGGDTKLFHTWAYESVMPDEVETEVLDYEKASAMIRDSGGGGLSMCYCRHEADHLGKACDAPIDDVCTSLGAAAEWLIRRGFARPASTDELLRVLDHTESLGLVHLADNVQKNPAYICHCCGCCCGVLRTINEHNIASVHPSNFIPAIDEHRCTGCGACLKRCHVRAISLIERSTGGDNRSRPVAGSGDGDLFWPSGAGGGRTGAVMTGPTKVAFVLTDRCIGCGACVKGCRPSAISLVRRGELHIPPKDKKEQMLRIAQGKGKR
ncbi:4fe-4S ferredoxin, iron-sulfur binding domain protein, putative [Heliomicrobium modesticaldum Ice1]|uniref:4fe-4S ferredoxin, iron-sulfur binding domain protein, putative n=1 Tax=Heliobacterium modesticaldum (strain ATCC 51547 / Ice1) TaxID=498761 RepID=B0TAI3_HELMI|nr:4Fe-4S dicluster domain-containing protein [Heliomicrobium modesticaldum]ABZ85033.1 4fe-4S ferredoxin, iron-sulfur binding domain protein, putative [Heliomicrobium modesticaldum Ice1]